MRLSIPFMYLPICASACALTCSLFLVGSRGASGLQPATMPRLSRLTKQQNILYYKILGVPEDGETKPSVIESGSNKVETGNLNGSFRERVEASLREDSSKATSDATTLLTTEMTNNNNYNINPVSTTTKPIHKEQMRHWGSELELDTQPLEQDGSVSTAGRPTPASSILADYMTNPDTAVPWEDMTVVELGSGIGTCSIVAALSGAYVIATDGSPTSLALIQQNSVKYQEYFKYGLQVEPLVWGDMQRAYEICQGQYPGLILASDVVFPGSNLETLKATLQALCGPETWIFLAHTWRADSQMDQAFFDSFLDEFERYEADPSIMPQGYQTIQPNGRTPVSVFMFRRFQ